MKQFFLNLIAGTLTNVGESELEGILQQLHDKHPDQYKAAIFGGRALVNSLKPLTDASPSKIDDLFIKALGDAIETSATLNGVVA